MEEIVFEAEGREIIGKQVRALRREGRLPAILYGVHIGSIPISLDFHAASYVMPHISSSQLVKVKVAGGEEHTALIRERQRHPVTGALMHIDFQAVSLTERLRTAVRIELTGESPAVKNLDGILQTGQELIEVECLPGDLPERIVVDISGLNDIGDVIHVRDLQISAAVEILTDPDEMIVLVTAPTLAPAEEEGALAEATGEAEPAVIERGKKEEEFE